MSSPRRISVPLRHPDTASALIAFAREQFRDPRDQAALFIVDGLRRAGVLNSAATTPPVPPRPSELEHAAAH